MIYSCPRCNKPLSENQYLSGICISCQKVFETKDTTPIEIDGLRFKGIKIDAIKNLQIIKNLREAAGQTRPPNVNAGGCLGLIIVIAGILTMSRSCNSTSAPPQPRQTPPTQSESSSPSLEVLECSYHRKNVGTYDYPIFEKIISGKVRNNTSRQYAYAQVEFNLYDSSGNQVGSTFTNINNLEPGNTWNFEAIVIEDSAVSYKLKGVSGW